jgi:hypothetical protein
MTEKVLLDEHRSTPQSSEDVERSHQVVDSDSRIELLERNLRYIQQQHEITLADLHNEIHRLQQENKDLQYRLISDNSTEQNPISNDQQPVDDKKDNQLKLELRIAELEKQLTDNEDSNKYLLNKITDLNKLLASKSEIPEPKERQVSASTNDSEYQSIIISLQEKQQQYLQEVNLSIYN